MNTVLFDLDGTLLQMDQRAFVEAYFGEIVKKFGPKGYDGKKLISVIWEGTRAMIKNDGSMMNDECFWRIFDHHYGEGASEDAIEFDRFYANEFNNVAHLSDPAPLAVACVRALKEKGYTVILATSPVFPEVATRSRLRWIGLEYEDFDWVTTYANSSYCKPNLKYFEETIGRLGKQADECLMIGNDVAEDMCAEQLGMEVFLLHPYIINAENADVSKFRQGDLEALYQFICELPPV